MSTDASSHPDVDMQDSDSTDSFSDDNETGHQCQEFGFEGPLPRASSLIMPESQFEHHATSAQPTPGPFTPLQSVPCHTLLQDFSFPDNHLTTGFQTFAEGDDLFSSAPGTYFDANSGLAPRGDVRAYNTTAPTWDADPFQSSTPRRESAPVVFHSPLPKADGAIAPFPSPVTKCEEVMTGSETAFDKSDGSTLILEHVQPQMVTSIINLLFQSKSVVKMKIVSQE